MFSKGEKSVKILTPFIRILPYCFVTIIVIRISKAITCQYPSNRFSIV